MYKENYPEKVRTDFRAALREKVEELVANNYHKEVSESEHVDHIKSIVTFSKDLVIEQANIPINFGVAQKMLNLYLKYLWCLGDLKFLPPHFPVDRIIQIELNKIAKESEEFTEPRIEIKAWTQFEDETDYLKVIDFARLMRDNVQDYKGFSLAQLELTLFDRR